VASLLSLALSVSPSCPSTLPPFFQVRLKVEKSVYKQPGKKYSCIRVLEVDTGLIRVLKKAKEPNDTADAYYETVKIQVTALPFSLQNSSSGNAATRQSECGC
jgi:hypothetical protein